MTAIAAMSEALPRREDAVHVLSLLYCLVACGLNLIAIGQLAMALINERSVRI